MISPAAKANKPSTAAFTAAAFKPVRSATVMYALASVIAPDLSNLVVVCFSIASIAASMSFLSISVGGKPTSRANALNLLRLIASITFISFIALFDFIVFIACIACRASASDNTSPSMYLGIVFDTDAKKGDTDSCENQGPKWLWGAAIKADADGEGERDRERQGIYRERDI